MKDHAHENLMGLLRRFMDEPAARAAHEDIRAGERWLNAYPAPRPDAGLLGALQRQMMATAARRRHRVTRWIHGAVAAAAVIVVALIGLFYPGSGSQSSVSMASLLPASVWDSDDITADDHDLAYFSAQLGQLEAQMQALDGDDSEISSGAPDDLEMELMAIQAEFLKG